MAQPFVIEENPGYASFMSAVGEDNSLLFKWVSCKEIFNWNMACGWVYDNKYKIGYDKSWLTCRSYIPFNWDRPIVCISSRTDWVSPSDVEATLSWVSNHFKVSPFNLKIRSTFGKLIVYQVDMDAKWFLSPVSVSLILSLVRLASYNPKQHKDGYASNFERVVCPFSGDIRPIPYLSDDSGRCPDLSYLIQGHANGNLQKLVNWTLKPVNNPKDWTLRWPNWYGVRNTGFVDWRPESDGPSVTAQELESAYGLNHDRLAY